MPEPVLEPKDHRFAMKLRELILQET